MYRVINEDLNEQVYRRLREMIVKRELQPNQKLIQEELASRLGVSRTPLLSAFAKLEREMLVKSIPRRGYFVRSITLKELLDIYEIRLRLETLGASEAARKCDHSVLEALSVKTDDMISLDAEKLKVAFPEYDYEFHTLIMKMSDNDFLVNMVGSFNLVTLGNIMGMYRDPRGSLFEHKSILGAIRSLDCELAESAMFSHISVAKSRIEQYAKDFSYEAEER